MIENAVVNSTMMVITIARVDEPRRRIAEDPEAVERSPRRSYERPKRRDMLTVFSHTE